MIKADNKRIAITLTEKEYEILEKHAKNKGINKSVILKIALEEYMQKRKIFQYK